MNVKELSNEQLVEQSIALDRRLKQEKKSLDTYKAEAQARGLAIMENQNLRFLKIYGKTGSIAVTDTQSLDILNMDKLKELLGEGVIKEKVKVTTETKYKLDTKLERALKAIFTGDYTFEYTLEEFLEEMSVKPDEKQKKVLLKKLKGNYEQDRKLILSVFGFADRGKESPDFDVELWYIYKIKNAELIQAFLPEEGIDGMIAEIKKRILVETKTGITIDYDAEG